jgi:hypothetical protein
LYKNYFVSLVAMTSSAGIFIKKNITRAEQPTREEQGENGEALKRWRRRLWSLSLTFTSWLVKT